MNKLSILVLSLLCISCATANLDKLVIPSPIDPALDAPQGVMPLNGVYSPSSKQLLEKGPFRLVRKSGNDVIANESDGNMISKRDFLAYAIAIDVVANYNIYQNRSNYSNTMISIKGYDPPDEMIEYINRRHPKSTGQVFSTGQSARWDGLKCDFSLVGWLKESNAAVIECWCGNCFSTITIEFEVVGRFKVLPYETTCYD
jgi:hypothetical protein